MQFSDLITVFIPPAVEMLIRVGLFTCGKIFWSIIYINVFNGSKNIFFYLKPVGSWRVYFMMVIGVHDSMITITNGDQCHTLVTPRSFPGPIRKN